MNRSDKMPLILASIAAVLSVAVFVTAATLKGCPREEVAEVEVAETKADTPQAEDGAQDDGGADQAEEEPIGESAPDDHEDPALAELKGQVEQALAPYGDAVSVVYAPLDGSGDIRIRDDVQMRSASMIKLVILADLLESLEAGDISPDATVTVRPQDIVGGTGSIQGRGSGIELTIDELAWHMIAESDNTATNILIDLLGFDAINETAKRLGLAETHLGRKMMDYEAIARGEDNYTSARDVARLLLMIGRDELVSPEQSERARGYLEAQTDTNGITQGIPAGTRFAHKTGVLEDVRHDGGIVYPEEGDPYVLVVMARLPQGAADSVSAEVSRIIWEGRA